MDVCSDLDQYKRQMTQELIRLMGETRQVQGGAMEVEQ